MSFDKSEEERNRIMHSLFDASAVRARSRDMLNAIRANRKRLDECPKHRFEIGEPPYRLGAKATCMHCHGEMELTSIDEYLRGYRAAGGNPNDIVPGWE